MKKVGKKEYVWVILVAALMLGVAITLWDYQDWRRWPESGSRGNSCDPEDHPTRHARDMRRGSRENSGRAS